MIVDIASPEGELERSGKEERTLNASFSSVMCTAGEPGFSSPD